MHLKLVKPQTEAEKFTRTATDTIEVTPDVVKSWKKPPFQRPLRENAKLRTVAAEIAVTQVVPGIITLGVLDGDRYLIDGQHRKHAFLLSAAPLAYVDVRVAHYKSMAEMSEEFNKLNSRISPMKPDDYLRAMECSEPQLIKLRRRCPFVGYEMIRRGEKSPLLSMSSVLRQWWSSSKEVPTGTGITATDALKSLSDEDTLHLGDFLELAREAWGQDPEYFRLWNNLNLVLCMWLYRRTVMAVHSARGTRVTKQQFKQCLMALSAAADYLEWLRNRNVNDQNRSPAYRRIKDIFAKRLNEELGAKPVLPAPEWGGK